MVTRLSSRRTQPSHQPRRFRPILEALETRWLPSTIVDLGNLGNPIYIAVDKLNDAGQVVGSSITASYARHAYLYQDGVMTDLGTLGGTNSEARKINDAGQVVGYAQGLGTG